MTEIINCKYCGAELKKDWVALNKKMLGADINEFACIDCLADDLECEVEDLEIKIDEFKEQGCKLFN